MLFILGLFSVHQIRDFDGVQLLLDFPPPVFDENSGEGDANFYESGSHARGLPD